MTVAMGNGKSSVKEQNKTKQTNKKQKKLVLQLGPNFHIISISCCLRRSTRSSLFAQTEQTALCGIYCQKLGLSYQYCISHVAVMPDESKNAVSVVRFRTTEILCAYENKTSGAQWKDGRWIVWQLLRSWKAMMFLFWKDLTLLKENWWDETQTATIWRSYKSMMADDCVYFVYPGSCLPLSLPRLVQMFGSCSLLPSGLP